MPNSKNSQTTSQSEEVQLPLQGFKVEVKSHNPKWRKFIETKANGRIRMSLVKNG